MSDTQETSINGVQSADVHRDNRLYRVLAWVGIVAGIVFIVGAVFFSGFFAGKASGGYGWHRGHQSGQMQPNGQAGGCPMMQMMQPGGMGPGGMPGTGGAKGTGPSSATPMPSVPMPMPPTTAGR